MTASSWNPAQYEKFKNERSQPFFDLIELVQPAAGMRVVDLGCGTGELTRVLHERLRARETVGIDSSETMLAGAAAFAGDGLRFERGDIRDFRPGPTFNVVFSNAALQWVPDHERLIAQLAEALADSGQLAVQVPANDDQPAHVVAAEVARESPFREALGGYVRVTSVLKPEQYAVLLDRLGFREQTVRMQVYAHRLPSREGVVEWIKGSTLTDYERRLPRDLFARYLDRFRELLLPRLVDSRPHFYPFKRILFRARR